MAGLALVNKKVIINDYLYLRIAIMRSGIVQLTYYKKVPNENRSEPILLPEFFWELVKNEKTSYTEQKDIR